MLRRWSASVALAALGMTGAWEGVVSEYFGRVDPVEWQQEHPEPPAPPVELGKHVVRLLQTERVVPSDGLPPEVVAQQANNNLDVVRHSDGRVYLAWRTAPSHFAGT